MAALLAALYAAVHQFFAAAVILGFAVFLLGLRIRFHELPDDRGGDHALRHFRVELAQTLGLLIVLTGTLVTSFLAAFEHWTRSVHGTVAVFALCGLEILLLLETQRRGNSALNWLVGGKAEQRVGAELEPLRTQGWLVIHRLTKDFGGDVDHVVCGPHGAYAIETKSSRFAWRYIGQAQGSAKFARYKLGLSHVEPVVCVGEEFRPTVKGSVWVMSANHLVPWLLSRREDPIDVEQTATRFRASVS